MPAVAMTDHANLMGAFHFVRDILNHNKAAEAKTLIEGEDLRRFLWNRRLWVFVCEDHKDKTRKDNGYQIVLLAKTKKGYHNLAKMSIAYTQGFIMCPELIKGYSKK
jgi:DNA polymerase-3 subunit alpha